MRKDFVDIMNDWFDSRMDDIHTIIPGTIEKYEGHKERKATVKPLVKLRTNKELIIGIDPIENVPVIFPSTKTFNLLYPLKKGDGVLLLFSEVRIGNYLNSTIEQEADDSSRFSLTDCIAIPGLWSFKNVPTPPPENDTDFFLKFQESKIQILDSTNEIKIEDKNKNKVTLDGSIGITIEDTNGNKVELTAAGIKITDKNSNTIDMGITSVKINNNLEVLK